MSKNSQTNPETWFLPSRTYDINDTRHLIEQIKVVPLNAKELQRNLETLINRNPRRLTLTQVQEEFILMMNQSFFLLMKSVDNQKQGELHFIQEVLQLNDTIDTRPVPYYALASMNSRALSNTLGDRYFYHDPSEAFESTNQQGLLNTLKKKKEKPYPFNLYKEYMNHPWKIIVEALTFEPSRPSFLYKESFFRGDTHIERFYYNRFGNYYMPRASYYKHCLEPDAAERYADEFVDMDDAAYSEDEQLRKFKLYFVDVFCKGILMKKKVPRALIQKWMNNPGFYSIIYHVKRVLNRWNDALFAFFMCFLAIIVQYPGFKMDKSIFVTGSEGTGKSVFFTWFINAVLGNYHTVILDRVGDATHQFNNLLENKLFVFIDETIKSIDTNHIKTMISSKTITIEKKCVNKEQQENFMNFVASSNNPTPVQLDNDINNRRYHFINSSPEFTGDSGYFESLIMYMRSFESADLFYSFLMFIDLSKFKHQDSPLNQEMTNAQMLMKTPCGEFVDDAFFSKKISTYPPSSNRELYDPDNADWQIKGWTSTSFYNAYLRFHERCNSHNRPKVPLSKGVFYQQIMNTNLMIHQNYKDTNEMEILLPTWEELRQQYERRDRKNVIPLRFFQKDDLPRDAHGYVDMGSVNDVIERLNFNTDRSIPSSPQQLALAPPPPPLRSNVRPQYESNGPVVNKMILMLMCPLCHCVVAKDSLGLRCGHYVCKECFRSCDEFIITCNNHARAIDNSLEEIERELINRSLPPQLLEMADMIRDLPLPPPPSLKRRIPDIQVTKEARKRAAEKTGLDRIRPASERWAIENELADTDEEEYDEDEIQRQLFLNEQRSPAILFNDIEKTISQSTPEQD